MRVGPAHRIGVLVGGAHPTLLTLNRKHFIRLDGTVGTHAGIIVCTFDADHVGRAGRITAAVAAMPSLAGLLFRSNR